ncbi:MAG: hypothetical protein AVDCRST_MAG41-1570, partial [uncultured Corynebacteriales bacterium]
MSDLVPSDEGARSGGDTDRGPGATAVRLLGELGIRLGDTVVRLRGRRRRLV